MNQSKDHNEKGNLSTWKVYLKKDDVIGDERNRKELGSGRKKLENL